MKVGIFALATQMCPTVLVPGFGFNKVYLDNTQTTAWPPVMDESTLQKDLLGVLMKMSIFRKDAGFSSKVASMLSDVCAPFAAADDGTLKNEARLFAADTLASPMTSEEYTALCRLLPLEALSTVCPKEQIFLFTCVFARDPLENGEQLEQFIERVCEQTGSEKVNLLSIGCGCTAVTAYLASERSTARLERLVYCYAPLDGTLLMTDLLLDSLDYTKCKHTLREYMSEQDGKMFIELDGMIPGLLENVFDKSLTVLREALLNLPAAWALVPSDDYPDLRDELMQGKDRLRERTDAFHEKRSTLPQTLARLREHGAFVALVSGMHLRLPPVCLSQDVISDSIVHTASSALNPSVTETADPQTEAVNTAAAYFPDTTWYIDGVPHMKALRSEAVTSLLCRLLSEDVQTLAADEHKIISPLFSNNSKGEE